MTLHQNMSAPKSDTELTEREFSRISEIAKAGWGLNLESAKRPLIKSRLGRRLKELNLDSFDAYCDILQTASPAELDRFVSALTTNVTQFYRELHHFETLQNEVLPGLIKRARSGERIRLWSAGCSSGQEPYSLAALICQMAPDIEKFDFKILATDIDVKVLETAKNGTYNASDINFPTSKHETWVFGTARDEVKTVLPHIKSLISFRSLNLVGHWPVSGRFDVIMCRNVAIYFDRDTQNRLWSRFAKTLQSGGYLFIGHSERINSPERIGLNPAGVTTYALATTQNASRTLSKG